MNKTTRFAAITVASLAALSAGAARADEAAAPDQRPLTRAEVIAAVLAARQSGELLVIESGGTWTPPSAAPARTLSSQEVADQVMAARKSGELLVIESGGTWSSSTPESHLTREQVAAEVLAARQAAADALALEHSL